MLSARLLVLLIAGLWLPTLSAAEPLLIEAEDFTAAKTDSDDFAKTSRDASASGKAVLSRIFNKGTVHYEFDVPRAGRYTGWVRYWRKVAKAVRCDVNGETFESASAPSVSPATGQNAWGYGKLFTTTLRAGKNSLVVHPSPWRIDCFILSTDPQFVPDDEFIHQHNTRKYTAEELALMKRQIVPALPDFLADAGDYELPAWFDGHRVHLHTRLSIRYANKQPDLFFQAASQFKKMGVTVFSRHIVTGDEGAWWPTETGAVHELARERNIAKELIDDAHQQGLKIIAYYRHIEDEWAATTHPDWCCLDPDGKPAEAPRGIAMCMNSPYADYVLKRQLELVDLGVDGLYYDSCHMPRQGCWCQHCRKAFRELTGLEHPQAVDPEDPAWHKLKEFNNDTMARVIAKWRKALHARNPQLVMVIGSNLWPCLSDKQMDDRSLRLADCHKTEHNKGLVYRSPSALWAFPADFRPMEDDVRLGFGYDAARDVTDGRPAHVWSHNIRAESHMLAVTAGIVTHGCIANLDVEERRIPDPNFRSSFALGERVSPYLTRTKPVRWVAILHSESARNGLGLDARAVWEKTLYPMYGAYHVLCRDRLPVGFLFDTQLLQRQFDGISAIFVPDIDDLSTAAREALAEFEKRGGTVIVNQPTWQWQSEAGWPQATAQFRKALAQVSQPAPAQAVGGNEKAQLQVYRNKAGDRLTVCLANDYSWAKVGGKGAEGWVEGDNAKTLQDKPAPCQGVVLKLNGKPRKVFDAVSGKELKWSPAGVRIPAFEYLAVIVAEY